MSREIKFRAWDKENETYLGADEAFLIADKGLPARLQQSFGYVADENLVIEQYTGLKDKSGKEIYEGDIVKCQRPAFHMKTIKDTNICTVRFKDGLFAFYDEKGKLYCDCIHNMTERKDVEIMGNIHENQELLEAEE